ncbi:amidohydrolase family protein [Sulfolobus tengchongensis]|uniref:Amidohydrolase family protein n=1 Tax=Sulfolobus tengchongensis TaxID=207809 RepID=A0AAX4L083_9CREN
MAYRERRVVLNVRLGLFGENLEIRENVNLEIQDGVVTHIGNGFSSEGLTFKNGILIPALVNSHVHAADFICQEMGYNKSIREVVGDPNSIKYKCLNSHTKEDVANSLEKFSMRAKELGSNIIIDFREQGIEGSLIAEKVKKEKLIPNHIRYYILGRLEQNELTDENLKKLHGITDGYGLSSESSGIKLDLIKQFFKDKIRAVHVSETERQWLKNDLIYLIEEYEPNLIIHGTHLSEEEIEVIKEKEISLVYCPRSNLWFSVGIPKVVNGLRKGVNLLIGTDNGGVLDPDLWKEMETLLLISRIQEPFSDYSLQILKAATINAYRFLGINGWIEEGKRMEAGILIIEGENSGILSSNNKYLGIIKRGNKIIYNLGAIQKII